MKISTVKNLISMLIAGFWYISCYAVYLFIETHSIQFVCYMIISITFLLTNYIFRVVLDLFKDGK